MGRLIVIGGGLAGSEAAWQAAEQGVEVILYEMRPVRMTPAHTTDRLAELVCSNSLGSNLPDRASGLLKEELRRLGSLIMACADRAAVPAGGALAVDRDLFAALVTRRIEEHLRIQLIRQEVTGLPDDCPTVVATGPLTSETLARHIGCLTGSDYLYFYDAMAPIVSVESINMDIAYRASRYGRGSKEEGDYINCPLSREEYEAFVDALIGAETIPLRDFEQEAGRYFEGCLPVETLARRGGEALAFGPMRPVGLHDPRTGRRPFAVVQLRQDNLAGTLYSMVGFQTNLRWGEQERVFRLIPGLERVEFVRFGQMHRNTFINSPRLLLPTMQFRSRPDLFFAGQITGVEGYIGSVGAGWVAGINAGRLVQGKTLLTLPPTTILGALCHYVAHADPENFQPMKANFGLLPPLAQRRWQKRERYYAYAERALEDLKTVVEELGISHSHTTLFRAKFD
jgi:methylenetetrahydrofolate--tRNA-(uracil-5-)-methyltransferase